MSVICPYCNQPASFVDSDTVYSRSYGMIYRCEPCDAHVGVHKGTEIALGRLANKELRYWKKLAHAAFDPIWQMDIERGMKKQKARYKAYCWLSTQMNLSFDQCHIGMFDVEQCKQVVRICLPIIPNLVPNF